MALPEFGVRFLADVMDPNIRETLLWKRRGQSPSLALCVSSRDQSPAILWNARPFGLGLFQDPMQFPAQCCPGPGLGFRD